jgi:hypothetical protein
MKLPMAVATPMLAAFIAFVALGTALPAAAADNKPREATFGKGKASGPLLTPAQLRECLATQDRLRGRSAETTREQSTLAARKADIERLGAELKGQMATLDRTSADAVAAYNAQVQARDKMIDEYQDSVPAFNTQVEALKSEQASFAKACENRRYDENDEIAIRKGK